MDLGKRYKSVSGYNMLNSFLHPDQAYKDAESAQNDQWDETKRIEQPWIDQGQDQYGALNQGRQDLMNPGELQDKWSANYQTSPYAQQMLQQNQSDGLDAASSMGLMGSSAAVKNIQTGAHNVVNQDRQQYMNDLMQKYMAGIGIGQDLYGKGAGMAATMGGQSQQIGQDRAGLAYGRSAAPGAFFGKMAGMAGNLGLNYATGGLSGMANASNNMMRGGNAGYSG
jgi:hypothetical protein